MQESRVKKSLLNARVNTICYFLSLFVAFFTRKIFIDYLGTEFIGLTGTLQSLLGFLNLAELGIGSAIGYFLYKPLVAKDEIRLRELVSLLGCVYRIIGLVILSAGVVLALFLPLIYPDLQFSLSVVYVGYFAYLFSTLIGYFCNYKMSLLGADQKNYIITGYFQLTTTIKVILQMLLAFYYTNFIIYFVVEFGFGIVNSLILNYKIRQTYPWLETDLANGRLLFKQNPDIWHKVRDLFFHKIGGFVQYQIMPFLIYGYVSLPMVALYTNYTIITQKIQGLVGGILGSTGSGVGSLIAEGDKDKIYNTFKELFFLCYFAAFIVSSAVYYLVADFIALWLGAEYILSDVVAFLICINFFLSLSRMCVDQFIFGHGLFHDIWAPLVESLIFVVASVVFGSIYGLPGVLAGPIISLFLIVFIWKSYFLYSRGFHLHYYNFWILFFSHISIFIVSYFLTSKLLDIIDVSMTSQWLSWIVEASIFVVLESVICLLLLVPFSSGLRIFVQRILIRLK